jgi:aminoglycoside 3-N-acetyltransferase
MNASEAQRGIADALRALGVQRGGVAMVHSSLSSLGHVPGGEETVILALLDALGPTGTLLMPALTYERVTAAHPVFDIRTTPSNVGAIPEHFRLRAGTRRSLHPTHSVCGAGPRAEELLAPHALDDTPCGPHSPFRLLREAGGQVVMLGCGLKPNTSMHAVEEVVVPPYLFGPAVNHRLTLEDGREVRRPYRRHSFDGWVQRYDRLGPLLRGGEMRTGRVLEATAHVIETPALWERALDALRRDPFFFVERLF